jgi:hypothetical protein
VLIPTDHAMEQETRKNPEKNCPATKEIRRMPVYRRIMASQWMPIDGLTGRSLRSKFDFNAAFDKNMPKTIGYILDAGLDLDEQYGRPSR